MKTSSTDTELLEKFLRGELSAAEKLWVQARLLTEPELKQELDLHRKIHRLIVLYRRRKLMDQVEEIHREIFNAPGQLKFKLKIQRLFNPSANGTHNKN